jgi:hypothetical protein
MSGYDILITRETTRSNLVADVMRFKSYRDFKAEMDSDYAKFSQWPYCEYPGFCMCMVDYLLQLVRVFDIGLIDKGPWKSATRGWSFEMVRIYR